MDCMDCMEYGDLQQVTVEKSGLYNSVKCRVTDDETSLAQ